MSVWSYIAVMFGTWAGLAGIDFYRERKRQSRAYLSWAKKTGSELRARELFSCDMRWVTYDPSRAKVTPRSDIDGFVVEDMESEHCWLVSRFSKLPTPNPQNSESVGESEIREMGPDA